MTMHNMRKNLPSVFVLAFLAFATFAVFASGHGWAAKGDLKSTKSFYSEIKKPLMITMGKAELVEVNGDVSDVLIADPTKVDVIAVQSNRLYVVGLTVGDTNLIALDARGNVVRKIDVHVTYDLQVIQSMVDELFPDEDAKVGSLHDQVLLTGTVSTPEVSSKISNIVGHYVSDLQDEDGSTDELISNLLEVRGEQQVMLQVKIIEASRTILKELGIETNLNDPNELAATTLFGTTPGSSLARNAGDSIGLNAGVPFSNDAPLATLGGFVSSGINGVGVVGLFIDALEEENLVNVLAEPNLTSVSGEQAGFLAGGEFPVPQGLDNTGNVVIAFRQFGVSLNFRPIVLSDDRISLQLNTEVSSVSSENSVSIAGVIDVPGRDIRRAETTVEIPSGASLMIAGLIQSETIKGLAGLPGIRNTPVLGDLVSSDSFKREETELVVIVTPYLVEPFAEKDRSTPVPAENKNMLANAFAVNIRRAYPLKPEEAEDMFGEYDQRFGYLLR